MSPRDHNGLEALAEALAAAINAHDIDAFVSLFAPAYESQQPAHPDRAFVGRDRVRAGWSSLFADVSDLRAELLGTAVDGDTLWSVWRWRGASDDGRRFDVAG